MNYKNLAQARCNFLFQLMVKSIIRLFNGRLMKIFFLFTLTFDFMLNLGVSRIRLRHYEFILRWNRSKELN